MEPISFRNQRYFARLAPLIAVMLCHAGAVALAAPDAAPAELPDSPGGVVSTSAPPSASLFPSDSASPAAPAAPSRNVTINLINRLVKRGVLTKEDSVELIKQAEQDAEEANSAAQPPAAPPDDEVRVAYVPEVVKAKMRDEIKDEVLAQARAENWAAPRLLPSWAPRFRVLGDIRVRYEGDFFPGGNDNTGAFPNFNAINTGSPFDTSGAQFSPQSNVDQTRNRFRLRIRIGAEIDLGEGFTAGVRVATGENDSPVTENQSLGLANQGQGGDFSKYAIWLDRGFLKYEVGGQPDKDLAASIGRFDNPFFAPSTIIWADSIGFDGAAIQAKYPLRFYFPVTPFLNAGAFPVFNTDFNFASNQPAKFKSEDKWLYAAQIGASLKPGKDISAKVGAAFYYYQNIEGKLSTPFTPLTSSDAGNTDDTRPSFAQNGNTYRPLRDIVANANNNFGTIDQFQYYGLATPFHELAVSWRADYHRFEPFDIGLSGEFVENLAFNRGFINGIAVNNRGSVALTGGVGAFAGGNTAWTLNLNVGKVALEKLWDWNASVGYRYVESDSVVDGFTDADFGGPLTGTNLKGFTVTGSLALSSRVWLFLRWMSAENIAGAPYKNDVVQFDVNAKF